MVRELAPKKASRQDGYTAGYYDYKTSDICLAHWDGDNKIIERQPFRNYFYLKEEEYKQIRSRELDMYLDDVKSTKDGYVKLYSSGTRSELQNLVDWMRKKNVEPLEADLPPIARFLTDHPVKFSEDPRVLFFDLETDARLGWSQLENHRILSVSYWSESCDPGDTIVAETDDDQGEIDLLGKFGLVIAKHDILVAWNGDEYDEPVMRARCKHNKLWPKWQMVNFLDMMQLFKHPYFGYGRDTEGTGVKLTFGLDKVGSALLDMPKTDIVKEMQRKHGMGGSHPAQAIYQAWMQDKLLLKQYNSRDVNIMVRLEQKFGYVDGLKTLSHICNRFLSSFSLYTGYLNDAYILRQGNRGGKHFPTKFHFYGSENPFIDQSKIEGAYVMEPVSGLYRGVCCLDFASLYPNVIRTFNISPETFIGMDVTSNLKTTCIAANGATFRMDKEGVFPAMVAETMSNRKQYKVLAQKLEEALKEGTVEHRRAKQRSDANKVIGNSGFGILSSPDHRYYSRECGEAVTVTSKQIILLVIAEAEACGIKVLYSDTDSIYILAARQNALEFAKRMVIVIDAWVVARGGEPGFIHLELDAEYTRIVFVGKKNYAGMKTTSESGKPDVKGLAYIRTDGCPMRQQFQKAVIDYLLENPDPNMDGAREIVLEYRDRLFGGDVDPVELTITKGIQKPPDQYNPKTVQVRVAEQMIKDGREFFVGMKVPYILTGEMKEGKSKHQMGIFAGDFTGKYDADLYWKSQIFPATQQVLEAAFPELPWKAMLKYKQGDQKQATIDLVAGEQTRRKSKVTLVLDVVEDKDKFDAVKEIVAKYPGDHPLVLDLVKDIEQVQSVITGTKVALVPALVVEVEKIVGRRCYYGPEGEWDATGTS